MAERNTSGGLPFGEVTIPFLDYKMPTIVLIALAVFLLFFLHLVGLRFVGMVGVGASAS